MTNYHLLKQAGTILLSLIIIGLLATGVFASNQEWRYNPFTGRQDVVVTYNSSDWGSSSDTVWGISSSQYLENRSDVLDVNETELNATIDARDADTTYTESDAYLTLIATVFGFSETKLNATIAALSDIDTWNTSAQIRAAVNDSVTYVFSTSGLSATSTALAANGANCSAGSYPLGVDEKGAVESCTDATTEIDSAILSHKGLASDHHVATVDTTIAKWAIDGLWLTNSSAVLTFSAAKLNATITEKLTTTYYNASLITVVTGTPQGTNTSINFHDGVEYNISESGSDLSLILNFTIDDTFNQVVTSYESVSGETHVLNVALWSYTLKSWETFAQYGSTDGVRITSSFAVFDPDNHVSGGKVALRFSTTNVGAATHKWGFDWITISKGPATPSNTETDPFAVHRSGDTPLTANWETGGYNISIDSSDVCTSKNANCNQTQSTINGKTSAKCGTTDQVTNVTLTDGTVSLVCTSQGSGGGMTSLLFSSDDTASIGTSGDGDTVNFTSAADGYLSIVRSNLTFTFNATAHTVDTDTWNTSAHMVAAVNTTKVYQFGTTGLAGTATALAANGANCNPGNYSLGVDESGAVEDCTPVTDADTTYTEADAYLTLVGTVFGFSETKLNATIAALSDIDTWNTSSQMIAAVNTTGTYQFATSGLAGTATALEANPSDCGANTFADAIAANGDLTCNGVVDADVSDTITVGNLGTVDADALGCDAVDDDLIAAACIGDVLTASHITDLYVFTAGDDMTGNLTLSGGNLSFLETGDTVSLFNAGSSGSLADNSTCTIIYSPDGGTTLEVCN